MQPDYARRGFLRTSITIVPAAALAVSGCTQGAPNAESATMAAQSKSLTPYNPVFFFGHEWAFIQAAVARLIPADDTGPSAVEAGVPEFIDRQMDAVFGHAAIWYMQGPFVESAPEFGY